MNEGVKMPFVKWLNPENLPKEKIISKKIEAFEYFCLKIYEAYGNKSDNDLSPLKLQKLLFLTCAASIDKKETTEGLLSIFDNWYAMPYGHIEKDIYDYVRKNEGEFSRFKLSKFKMELK